MPPQKCMLPSTEIKMTKKRQQIMINMEVDSKILDSAQT